VEWQLVEAGHAVALSQVTGQRELLRVAAHGQAAARSKMSIVQRQLEVVRRAVARKLTEQQKTEARKEGEQLDALAGLLFAYR
jgi:hypothetical protein